MSAIAWVNSSHQFPLNELDEVEAAIRSTAQWMETLHCRRDALFAELDRLTCPVPTVTAKIAQRVGPGFAYRGEIYRHWTYIDIYVGALRKLWTDFPERRDAMARAMGRYGWSRCYVSTSVGKLFPGMPESNARRFSRTLIDGWFVDTNINLERMCRILPAAVAAAELTWGQDVRVFWRAEKAPVVRDCFQTQPERLQGPCNVGAGG